MSKALKRAQRKLASRIADYEKTRGQSKGNSEAYRKPGSMKAWKSTYQIMKVKVYFTSCWEPSLPRVQVGEFNNFTGSPFTTIKESERYKFFTLSEGLLDLYSIPYQDLVDPRLTLELPLINNITAKLWNCRIDNLQELSEDKKLTKVECFCAEEVYYYTKDDYFTYYASWDSENNIYIGTCNKLPEFKVKDSDYLIALTKIKDLVHANQ